MPSAKSRAPSFFDAAQWKSDIATRESLFGLGRVSARSPLTVFASEAPADADLILTPTRFIPANRLSLISAVLEKAAACDDPRVIPLIPTHIHALGPASVQRLCRTLNFSRSPVALLLVSDKSIRPFTAFEHVAGLRKLLQHKQNVILLACGPIIGLDAILHGAGQASIGISAMWRSPVPPGTPFRSGEQYELSMLQRSLWEHQTPSTFAGWYRGFDEPLCQSCPEDRRLSSFKEDSPADREFILRHNAHSWLEALGELDGLTLPEARTHLSEERRDALFWHSQLRPQVPLSEFDPGLRHLVEIDDGQLPAWLDEHPRR